MSLIADPKTHYEKKSELAQKEIADDSIVVALTFLEKRKNEVKYGALIATKVKADLQKVVPISVSGTGREKLAPFIIAGVGHYGELQKVFALANDFVQDSMNVYGDPQALSLKSLLKYLTREVGDQFINGPKAYGLDLLLLSTFTSQLTGHGPLSMWRIKYNGEYHPCDLFAVIGGNRPPKENELRPEDSKDKSMRNILIEALRKVYAKGGGFLRYGEAYEVLEALFSNYEIDKGEMISDEISVILQANRK